MFVEELMSVSINILEQLYVTPKSYLMLPIPSHLQRSAFIYLPSLGKEKKLQKKEISKQVFSEGPGAVSGGSSWSLALTGGHFPGERTGLPQTLYPSPLGPSDWPE